MGFCFSLFQIEKEREEKLAMIDTLREFELRSMEVKLESKQKIVATEHEVYLSETGYLFWYSHHRLRRNK